MAAAATLWFEPNVTPSEFRARRLEGMDPTITPWTLQYIDVYTREVHMRQADQAALMAWIRAEHDDINSHHACHIGGDAQHLGRHFALTIAEQAYWYHQRAQPTPAPMPPPSLGEVASLQRTVDDLRRQLELERETVRLARETVRLMQDKDAATERRLQIMEKRHQAVEERYQAVAERNRAVARECEQDWS